MTHPYRLIDEAAIPSPALIFFPEIIRRNIAEVIAMVGGPGRLRPHCKTHKTLEIIRMQLAAGVLKHKCATIAEAEMLALADAPEVLIAYPLVGPNLHRFVKLIQKYPRTEFTAVADHPAMIAALSDVVSGNGLSVAVLVDVNVGHDRTGVDISGVEGLYRLIARSPGLRTGGFHIYDGHNSMEHHEDREAAVRTLLTPVLALRAKLERSGMVVPRLVCGGTPCFPIYAKIHDIPGLECSPGTYVLQDFGYGSKYTDLSAITPAAVLLTRVVSLPTAKRVTLDLGTKAVASDPPAGKRVHLLDFAPHTPVGHNEEHYIVETPHASRYQPGDVVYALPSHICPTVALHKEALIAENGLIVGSWPIVARDRVLTV